MEVLEAIQKRRTVRVPFNGEKVPDETIHTLMEISNISPSGDTVSWHLVRVEDAGMKAKLSQIVKEDFGDYFQRDSERFRRVFSEYPKWLRFSDAQDGIRLTGFPKIARHFYRVVLGRRFGPLFGKMGVMNAEINAYCRNIMSASVLFGVFLDRRVGSTKVAPIINTGSMLQNLRLAATSLGLCYQDLGWITATKQASARAGRLLGMSDDYAAVNFFRVGYAGRIEKQPKKSDFRRGLSEVGHVGMFGTALSYDQPIRSTGVQVLDAIRGHGAQRNGLPVSLADAAYVLEAARWAPTGFNVQPFEFVVVEGGNAFTFVVMEDKHRRDPDPGPCEALARGGVLQNMRLAARALGAEMSIEKPSAAEEERIRRTLDIPEKFSFTSQVILGGKR